MHNKGWMIVNDDISGTTLSALNNGVILHNMYTTTNNLTHNMLSMKITKLKHHLSTKSRIFTLYH